MVISNPTTPSAKELADQLLAKREVIQRYVQELNALRSRVLAYEEQFGIPASDIHEAIEDGRLVETLGVCKWNIDSERYTFHAGIVRQENRPIFRYDNAHVYTRENHLDEHPKHRFDVVTGREIVPPE